MAELLQKTTLIGNELPWLRDLREAGKAAFECQGVPTAKTEAWKYTKPRDLNSDDFVLSVKPRPSGSFCEEQDKLPFDGYYIGFENGIFNPAASDLPEGVEVLPLIEALLFRPETRRYLGRNLKLGDCPFAALNTYYLNEGVFIRIEKNVELKKPLIFHNRTSAGAENLLFNLRNLIILERGAAAKFIEYYSYEGKQKSRYFANIVNEFFVSENAKLEHYKLQDEAFKANHVSLSDAEVQTGGSYHSFTFQKGANIARNETRARLCGENARAEVNAAYRMNGWAVLDTTTDIEHLSPCTFSDQLVKGVVGGEAKGVFQGKIHIAAHAVKTEGRQLHKALLLSDTAEIDVKPELEIFADDVKCSHGAASGELDEDALFYMQSRGIGEEDARRILVEAYLDDAVNRIHDPLVREWIRGIR